MRVAVVGGEGDGGRDNRDAFKKNIK